MLAIGLTLLAAAIVLLLLAFRGRITARGRFCRKCKFDLAGLTDPAACPECGRDLQTAKATRTHLRTFRLLPAAAAVLLLMLASAALLTASPAVQAWILPRVPDAALVWLHRADMSGANDEILARLADTKAVRPALRPIIERDLQRVLNAGVDSPRVAERLGAALTGGHLDARQAQLFFERSLRIDIAVREHVAPDASTVPLAVVLREDLFGTLGLTEYVLGVKPLYTYRLSVDDPEARASNPILEMTEEATIIRNTIGWHSHPLPLSEEQRAALAAGESVEIAIHAEVEVIDARTGSVVAKIAGVQTQGLRTDANPLKSIRIVDDADALREFAAGLLVNAPGFTGYGHSLPAPGQMFLSCGINVSFPLQNHSAYTVTVIGPDGQRLDDPAPFVLPNDGEGYGGLGTGLLFLGVPPLEGESADELFAKWESTEAIDIVLTPDLDLAYRHPMIDAILAGEIIFRSVPLQRSEGERLPVPNKRPWVTGEPLRSPQAP